jgi:uncharacterized membrane protein YtjA (UPF0391 family)
MGLNGRWHHEEHEEHEEHEGAGERALVLSLHVLHGEISGLIQRSYPRNKKTSSLTGESPAEDALLNGFPGGDLTWIAAISLHPPVELGDLFSGDWNFRWMGRQVVPELGDQKKLLGRSHTMHVGNGLEDHGWKIRLARLGTSSDERPVRLPFGDADKIEERVFQPRCRPPTAWEPIGFLKRSYAMLELAIGAIIVSIIAGALGFTGLAKGAAAVAKIIFIIFLIIAIVLVLLIALGVQLFG